MALEITNTDSDFITFTSERVGDLERMIRELRDLIQDITILDDDLSDCDLIDPDGLADQLLDRFTDAHSRALEAWNAARSDAR